MSTGPLDLHDALALDYLIACENALNTIPEFDPTLGGAPVRSFIAPGPPAFDCCDQLVVHVGSITPRLTEIGARITQVPLIAHITRCVAMPDDNGNPPPADEQGESARQINADKWALWNYIYAAVEDGLLFERCCGTAWGPLDPLTPSGGCGGSRLTVTVCFDGYEVVHST